MRCPNPVAAEAPVSIAASLTVTPPRSRIITQLRWLPRTVPPSSSPPSLSTRVTPTSSRTRYAPRRPVSGRTSPTAVSPADRAKEFFSAEPASDGNLGLRSPRPETATTTHIRRIQRPFRTRSDLAPTPRRPHRRSPMPCSTRASPRTPTPRCDHRPPSAVLAKTKKQKPKDYQINGSTRI